MEQGSNEWLEWRKKGIGGSDVAAILGISPWKTAFRLWQEHRGLVKNDYKENFAMRRGTENEPKARALVEFLTGKTWAPALIESDERPYFIGSLDGQNGNEILEIKVPSERLVLAIENLGTEPTQQQVKEKIPPYYISQMQYYMKIANAKRCLFVCFHPERNKLASCWLDRDDEYILDMIKKLDAWWDCRVSGEPPALSEKDYVEISTQGFLDDAKEFIGLTDSIKLLEIKLEACKKRILELAKDHPALRGGGIQITGYSVKGAIDYASIEALKFIDLEKYRKPSRQQFKITIKKE